MNRLLNPISWSAYLETLGVLAIAYYAFIGWKFYRPEIDKIIARLKGERHDANLLPPVLQYQADETVPTPVAGNRETEIADYEEPFGAVHDLGQALTNCINAASGKAYATQALIPQLKKILNDYPDIAATPERDEINALIVRECEKTGTALLSESEVDLWWSA